jgi:hypothetical protein
MVSNLEATIVSVCPKSLTSSAEAMMQDEHEDYEEYYRGHHENDPES